MIDLIAIAAVDRETEVTYIRRERDWADAGDGRGPAAPSGRLLPVLPASVAGNGDGNGGNGHDHGDGHGAWPRRARPGRQHDSAPRSPAARAGHELSEERRRGDPGDTIPFIGDQLERRAVRASSPATMLGAALLVVTMRDIIRCGLAMMVCFGALAGIYVMLGAPLVAAAQVLVYIGAISVLILFAIMLTQTKAAPARLVFQTQAVPAAVAAVVLAIVIGPRGHRHRLGRASAAGSTTATDGRSPRLLFTRVRPAVRGRRACSCSRPSSAACSWPSASEGGGRA